MRIVNCEAVDWGSTQWCNSGKHDKCSHRAGGQLEHGNWVPECYITIPKGSSAVVPLFNPRVVRPSHIYRCDCECHINGLVEQLEMFGGIT